MAQNGKLCRCGCGKRVKRTFAPGHDQRYVSSMAAAIRSGKVGRKAALRQVRKASPGLSARIRAAASR